MEAEAEAGEGRSCATAYESMIYGSFKCVSTVSRQLGIVVVNVNGACNRSDTDGCSRRMPLCILVVSSVPRSYTTYVGDTGTVRKLITCLLRRHAPDLAGER